MHATAQKPTGKRILWLNVLTVVSAAILIGAEVFGAAFAGCWAFADLFELGDYGVHILQALFFSAASPSWSRSSATRGASSPSPSAERCAPRARERRLQKLS